MEVRQVIISMVAVLLGAAFCFSQGKPKPVPAAPLAADLQPIRSSPAYSEVLFRKTELTANLESLLADYTEEFPKVKEIRTELDLIKTATDRLLAIKPADAGKLTLALGKLIVRKVELETDLTALRQQYKDDHPEVKKAKRKVEIFENAIKEILGS